jgi:tetratricopeptide (TPR) repeat protein
MKTGRTYAVWASLLGVLLGLPVVAYGASKPHEMSMECIGSEARKNMSKCPGGPSKFNIKKARGVAFKSAPPPRKVRKRKDTVDPGKGPGMMAAGMRDTRKTRLKARARALLITEIQGLERLFRRTPRKSPDRPQLVRRLAEAYVELESAAARDKTAAEIRVQDARAKKRQNSRARAEAAKATKIMKAARTNAIRYYTVMKKDYPNYSKIDEVLYYLAYEYEQAGDFDNARKVYYELIQKAPKSPYIPNAYLAFGELFFQEAMGDPSKWPLAAQAYQQVTNYPPPQNKTYGYARYKLGYVHWNTGDYVKAMNEFKKVIEFGTQHPGLPNARQLAKSARRDLIPVYAVAGRPERAYSFFRPLSGDKGDSDVKTIEMLNELGYAYLDTGHYAEAIALYQDLMKRDPGKRYCHYQTQITTAISATYSSDKERIKKELLTQLSVKKEFDGSGNPSKYKLECANRTAELLAETAMSWHLEAVGSGGVRGTGSKETMDLAAFLYGTVVENFTSNDFAKFKFPRIVKEDWPTIYKIKYAMADLLYFQKRWKECGPAFDAVVAENPKGEDAAEAAYAAVLCYQKMYDQMYSGDKDRQGKGLGPKGAGKEDQEAKKGEWEKFKPKELTDFQSGMITAFNRYVCYIKPPKGDAEREEQYVEVKYGRARTYYEAQHWEEAALGFRDVAINHADKDAGIYAAQLYLEALNVLGSRAEPPRPSCFTDMGKDVPIFIELYCTGDKKEDNKDQCELLETIQFDIRRLEAEKTIELADKKADAGDYDTALDKYEKGGDAYLALWRDYCETPLSQGEKPKQCERAEEIVYNMAKAYQAGRLLAKSIRARMILLDERYGLHETQLAMKATYEIGGNYQAIAVYDRAADFFEKYAEDTKYRGEYADQALSDSVVLRLGLGQEEKAIDDAAKFNRYHGRRKPADAAQIAFSVAAHFGEKKDWAKVIKYLATGMGTIDKNAHLDIRVQAHALLGRAHVMSKRQAQASGEYNKVLGLWKDPRAAAGQIQGIAGEDEASKTRRLGRALEGVGEAVFFFAEQKRAKVETVKFPAYTGPGDKEKVLKHINEKVAAWIKKKKPLIEEATKEYKKIIDLEPVPPPRWVIAAGARVGQMWGKFVDEFRAAPIPDYMKKDYELRTAYYGALDDASEPQKQTAKGAFETCLGYSVKYQYFDYFSRSCEEWLAKNYKAEYHLVDEFYGAPTHVNSALREHPYPLRIGGEPFLEGPSAEEAAKERAREKAKEKEEEEKGKKK